MNPIKDWIENDPKLNQVLSEIQSQASDPLDQANLAFERLCQIFNLPKTPSEVKDQGRRSVFEEHALLKFLNPNDDPRGLILSAIYNVKNNIGIDYKAVAKKEYGKEIPSNCQIGIKGHGIYGEVVFPLKENKSWYELGCLVNAQIS